MGAFGFFGFFFFTFITVYIFPCFQLEARPVWSAIWSVEVPGTECVRTPSGKPVTITFVSLFSKPRGFCKSAQLLNASLPLSLTHVHSFSISCLLRILRNFLFFSEQEKFTTGPPCPRCLSPLRSPYVSHRFMTAWTATAVGFSLIPLSPAWRRCSTRSAETQPSWFWSTSWYVRLLPRRCSGVKMEMPGRHLQG